MQEKTLHRLFGLSVTVKGVDGILEILGGFFFLFLDPSTIGNLVFFLTTHEISENRYDLVASLIRDAILRLSPHTTAFAGLYLIAHGVIKIFLVAGLLRGRLWSYPAALWFLGAFVSYQMYRITLTGSRAMILLTAFDLAVMVLIWHEFRLLKREGPVSRIGF